MKKEHPEKLVQDAVIKYLTLKKHCFWRNNSGALKTEYGGFVRFGAVGSPDICVIKDGFFIGLEIKSATGKQSEGQKAFEKMLKEAGAEYHIIKSVDQLQEIGL